MEHLRRIRKQKNVTQQQVAQYLGVDRTTYVKYETGASEPSLDTLQKLALYFGATLDELVSGSAPPPRGQDLKAYLDHRYATAQALQSMGALGAPPAPLPEWLAAFNALSPKHQALVLERIRTLRELEQDGSN